MSNLPPQPTDRAARIKRSLAQSDYITVAWSWFMILAGKAAEPVLVASVLYASVKLLPIVHFPSQYDVVVFIAQFIALDIGGLSLNKLADQARKEGNAAGAKQAKDLSIALVVIMLVGVIMAGVNQVVQLNSQVSTVIDTLLLIARAVLAVLYGRVIHSLRHDDLGLPIAYNKESIETLVAETIKHALAETTGTMRREMVEQIATLLSQTLDERLTMLDVKQADALERFKDEWDSLLRETTERVMHTVETALQKHAHQTRDVPQGPVTSAKVRSMTEATARKQTAKQKGKHEIDQVIWPLLNSGLSVRAIAAKAHTSPATVGRSRLRWETTHGTVSTSQGETETPPVHTEHEAARETEKRVL